MLLDLVIFGEFDPRAETVTALIDMCISSIFSLGLNKPLFLPEPTPQLVTSQMQFAG